MDVSVTGRRQATTPQGLRRLVPWFAIALVSVPAVFGNRQARSASIQVEIDYVSTIANDGNGPLDLKAELNYEDTFVNAPIAVVMHPYGGVTPQLAVNAQRLRDAGFFVISPTMRGQGGSDGTRESGGAEIYDIYDAVEHVKATYPQLVDATNVSITGYSGGGGNVMSALTKFPDYFRAGSAYFGMSDYGYDTTNGWFFNGADAGNKLHLIPDIGDPSTNDPAIQDRYMARASNLAAKNNPYSAIHLFVNADETNVPPINSTSYRDNAIAAAAFAGEFDNIQVHIGGNGEYVDFNGNTINDPNELQDWPHQLPTADQQHAGEAWYLSRLLDGSIPEPALNLQDTLFVAGFLRTERFALWLGDGQNAAAELVYDLNGDNWTFELSVLSNDESITGLLSVDTALFAGRDVIAKRNGQTVETFSGGGVYQFADFGDADQFTLSAVPEPASGLLFALGGFAVVSIVRRRTAAGHTCPYPPNEADVDPTQEPSRIP